jgi:hypothetical protein
MNLPLPNLSDPKSPKKQSSVANECPLRFQDLGPIEHEKFTAKIYRPYFLTIDTIKKF